MGFVTFLILFILIANFPGFIINPLHELMEGIHGISEKNYDIGMEFKTSEEFEQLAKAFNEMAAGLGAREKTDLTQVITEQVRIKALIEEMPEVIIGLNEKQEIAFINPAAVKMLNLGEKRMIGQSVKELMKNNDRLKAILDHNDTDAPLKLHLHGKVAYFQQKNIEIVVPNIKPDMLEVLQVAAYSAGMIYILKDVTEFTAHDKVHTAI